MFIYESGWDVRVIFTAERSVSDFRFISLIYCYQQADVFAHIDCGCISVVNEFHFLDELTPEMPLVSTWMYWGCFTSGWGISFVYDDVTWFFNVVHSNESGRLFLWEFEPS
jgi:hypothetical protein